MTFVIGSFIKKSSMCRLNYTANYADVDGVTVTAIDFGSIVGLQIYSNGFLSYFLDRGYTANVDIQIASYDWRLAPGKCYYLSSSDERERERERERVSE